MRIYPHRPKYQSLKILRVNPYNSRILMLSSLQLHCFHRPEGEGGTPAAAVLTGQRPPKIAIPNMVEVGFVAIFLGIDGGGTKTSCAIGDETSLIASATAGGSNIIRLGEEQARKGLREAIEKACAAANLAPSGFERICLGMAGVGRAEVSEIAQRILAEITSSQALVVGDMVVALEAAFGEGPGVIAIAGTGSIA